VAKRTNWKEEPLLGKVPDPQLARQLGVPVWKVSYNRRHRKILAATKKAA